MFFDFGFRESLSESFSCFLRVALRFAFLRILLLLLLLVLQEFGIRNHCSWELGFGRVGVESVHLDLLINMDLSKGRPVRIRLRPEYIRC